ncbi:HlyD family secretion protein [Anoxynatronum sibiricum]|uniref:Efflux RND transporter periplasmic adaptor subunit n=1 Tax=Anoxynatronum sibiricum TaxID=210623 RepID=A0ABU9VU22_9CLOT
MKATIEREGYGNSEKVILPETGSSHPRRKSRRVTGLAMMMGVVLLLSGCGGNGGEEPVQEVDLSEISRQVEAFGKVRAADEMSVSLEVPARIQTLQVRDGQQVTAGQQVMTLAFAGLEEEADNLRGELAVVRAEINAQAAEVSGETARLLQELGYAEKQLEEAREDAENRQRLYEAGAVPKEEMERYQREITSRESQVENLQLQLNQQAGTHQIQVRREQAALLENRLKRLEARLNLPFLEDNAVICPFDRAVVSGLEMKPGDRSEAYQRLLRFIDLDTLQVEADVLEEFIRQVEVGASVTLIPVADRSRTYTGRVETIADTAVVVNNETVVPVVISLEDADEFLRPQFNVDVFIDVADE